ncbi:MAG: asparagine synthase (glutamine-hydrolyzing) [Deltaproteobacteria bacterium]|nr:asparagine synthase (glutamine-hydrolyzing) [Deltaproteobacteria bacterium]
MCGIAGYVGTIRPNPIEAMLESIGHRGPDDSGYFEGAGVAVGNTRLAIIDRSGGHQPMVDPSGRYVLVYNGELYNFAEIKEKLTQKGFRFRTRSDSETVLYAYMHYGEKCLEHFNGMYAFAIWDCQEKELFLARDRSGEKPLYYSCCGNTFIFGSEIKTLLKSSLVPTSIDLAALNSLLTFRYIPGNDTLLSAVKRCPPAHTMRIKNGRVSLKRYWELPHDTDYEHSLDRAAQQFNDLLVESIKMRLISDVPVGMFLSGGVDSQLVASIISQLGKASEIISFTASFAGSAHSEEASARKLAQSTGFSNQHFLVEPSDLQLLPRLTFFLDDPVLDPIIVPTYLLAKKASAHVKVVLTGEGADEILGGYVHQAALPKYMRIRDKLPRYVARWMSQTSQKIPIWVFDLFFDYPESIGPEGRQRFGKLVDEGYSRLGSYLRFVSLFSDEERQGLLQGHYRSVGECLAAELESQKGYFESLIRTEFKYWLPGNILNKQDKLTMAASIEGRSPYLDHRLITFCAALPSRFKRFRGANKWLLRYVAEQLHGISPRKKVPFYMPITYAYRNEFKNIIETYLSEKRTRGRQLFDFEFVSQQMRSFGEPNMLRDKQLIALAMVEMWCDHFLGKALSESFYPLEKARSG